MRIAVVIDSIQPFFHGGYEHRAWQLARRLAQRHSVTVFTRAPEDQTIDGVSFRAIAPPNDHFDERGFRDLAEAGRFAAALLRASRRGETFDVVDCNATPFIHILAAARAARTWKAAFVVTAHEALSHTMADYFRVRGTPSPRIVGAIARGIYTIGHRVPDRVIASSAVAADGLRAEGIQDVAVCAGGVERTYPAKQTSRGRLVFVGRLVPNKRVDVLIEGFAEARRSGAATSLDIVGLGPQLDQLRLLAGRLGVEEQVVFRGELSEEEKYRLLVEDTDVFVSASRREGFSLATLEALATGNPAVISEVPGGDRNGAREYLVDGENGAVCDGTPPSLAAAIARVAGEPYGRLSANAVATSGSYTWDAVASVLEREYARLVCPP